MTFALAIILLSALLVFINQKLNKIMASQEEEASLLQGIKDRLVEASTEIIQKIADLTEAIKNAGNTTPEVDQATADLQSLAQGLADIVPNEPPPAP